MLHSIPLPMIPYPYLTLLPPFFSRHLFQAKVGFPGESAFQAPGHESWVPLTSPIPQDSFCLQLLSSIQEPVSLFLTGHFGSWVSALYFRSSLGCRSFCHERGSFQPYHSLSLHLTPQHFPICQPLLGSHLVQTY